MPLKRAEQHMPDRLVVKELTTKISFTQTFALKTFKLEQPNIFFFFLQRIFKREVLIPIM